MGDLPCTRDDARGPKTDGIVLSLESAILEGLFCGIIITAVLSNSRGVFFFSILKGEK